MSSKSVRPGSHEGLAAAGHYLGHGGARAGIRIAATKVVSDC